MVNCSVYGCKSRSDRKEPGITFHRFPIRDPQRTNIWVKQMQMADWTPTVNSRICSKHFEPNLFYKIGDKICLLDDAVPTIVLERPKDLPQPKKAMKRSIRETPEPTNEPIASTSGTSNINIQEEQETPRKKKLRRQLFKEISKSREKSKKIKIQGQKLRRYLKKVISLKQIVKELKVQNLLTSENALIFDNMNEISSLLQKRKLGKKVKYPPELRKFAITLSFFSPRAYDYVRKVFDTCLPHRSTIGKWFKNVNAEPGFTKESFNTLKKHVECSTKPTLLALIVDEIAIRKQLEWDGKKFHGYVNYGIDLEDDSNAMAKEAFVLLVVNINGQWKLPVGYFFTDGLSGEQKSTLVTQCIKLLIQTGAYVVSLTFDGAPSNITMTNILGCKTELHNLKTSFMVNENEVFIFYDPCHMLKLVRNTFGEKQILIDGNGNYIKWEYIEQLEKLQDSEGLHLGNKLRKAHINFFKQKMKVRLAVQLLSQSVADALCYCENELGLQDFEGCQTTAEFITMFNNIFDILNSRSLSHPVYKKALCQKNIEETSTFIQKAINYIASLKFDSGELVINSRRKTGFIGFIVSLRSTLLLYDKVISQNKMLIYLPLYKISQDHLELFFSSIRARGGWNNNPTARQFTSAYKRLLVRAEIREGGMGNCIPLDAIPILVGSSKCENPEENIIPNRLGLEEVQESVSLQTIWSDHEYIMNTNIIDTCSSQIIIYIAGFVVHHLQKTIKCEQCMDALYGQRENFLNSLISRKNRGGLTYPSKDVIRVCTVSEHFLRINDSCLTQNNFINVLKSKIMYNCIEIDCFTSLKNHVLETSSNHIYFLIEAIISKYLNIRIHFISKKRSEVADPVRSQLTKLILFKGQ